MNCKALRALLVVLVLSLAGSSYVPAEEGMWPISEIGNLNLVSKGLLVSGREIFNPAGVGLVNGIVQLGGCTGSFVSSEGLILTNHHCAFGAIQNASTPENDYLRNGFLAGTRSEEIPAKGFTARITETYKDVSADVLAASQGLTDAAERTKALEKRIKEIVAEAEKANPGKRAEVADMVPGKTYWLFLYTYLKDIRLVYAPPLGVGNFGGEDDNWMWPRHTGDFSFMRAYTAPDGSPADCAPSNVPYHPRIFLKVSARGVEEGDPVFLLGYPGRTFRHQPSAYLSYEEDVRMPFIAEWYAWRINLMETIARSDRGVALKHAGAIKGLANTMKNYRGKLKGLERLGLVKARQEEEKALTEFILSDPERKARSGELLPRFEAVYAEMRDQAPRELLLNTLRSSVGLVNLGYAAYEASIELRKPDLEREPAYMERNLAQNRQSLLIGLKNLHEPTDRAVFREWLLRAQRLPEENRLQAVDAILKAEGRNSQEAVETFLDRAYGQTQLKNESRLLAALSSTTEDLVTSGDPFIKLAAALYPDFQELKDAEKRRKGILDQLLPEFADVKAEFLAKRFIPDANRTLRFTSGRIKGYSPADGVFYRPVTTLDGVVEKTRPEEPYDTPQKVLDLWRGRDAGSRSVPVCMLYDADTTGGNSGSPVLNAAGELVGVNFDRTFEATINDYAWSAEYSRSIAVDIRYVLWVTRKVAEAEVLFQELMGR